MEPNEPKSKETTPNRIRGTISSSLGTSFLMDNFEVFLNDENEKDLTLKQEFYQEAEALGKLNIGYTLSDEEFVTKFVLAEQICRQKLFLINLKHFILAINFPQIQLFTNFVLFLHGIYSLLHIYFQLRINLKIMLLQ